MESFNRTLRDELLTGRAFHTVLSLSGRRRLKRSRSGRRESVRSPWRSPRVYHRERTTLGGGACKLSNEKRESYSIAVQITAAEKKKLATAAWAEMRSVANYVTKVIIEALGRDSPVSKKF